MSIELESINKYLDILDKYELPESRKNSGGFSFLTDELLVSQIVVSPNNHCKMSGLKTFLLKRVLEIKKEDDASKITHTTIRKCLEGKGKAYKFKYDLLIRSTQKEANLEAFLKESRILREVENAKEMIEKYNKWIPYILFDQLRKTAWELLGEYYGFCNDEDVDEDEDVNVDCKKKKERKKDIYYQFTQTVVLMEIFTIEYICIPIQEYLNEIEEVKENIQKSFENISSQEPLKNKDIELLNKTASEVSKFMDTVGFNVIVLKFFEAEFAMEFCAMLHILLVFEVINNSDYSDEKSQVGTKLDTEFMHRYKKFFGSFLKTNKNKFHKYNSVNEYLEGVLIKYADKKYKMEEAVIAFLEKITEKNNGVESEDFHKIMCYLAFPVYKKLCDIPKEVKEK